MLFIFFICEKFKFSSKLCLNIIDKSLSFSLIVVKSFISIELIFVFVLFIFDQIILELFLLVESSKLLVIVLVLVLVLIILSFTKELILLILLKLSLIIISLLEFLFFNSFLFILISFNWIYLPEFCSKFWYCSYKKLILRVVSFFKSCFSKAFSSKTSQILLVSISISFFCN